MIKILFFIFDLGHGGAEKVLTNLVSVLSPKKYDITVHTLFDYGVNKKFLPQNVTYKSYLKRKPFHGITYLLKLLGPKFLYKLIIKDKYDIAIAYLENSTTRIIGGCPYNDTKLFAWVHSQNTINIAYRSRKEQKRIYENFTKTVFVSEVAKNAFLKKYPQFNINPVVVYNTLDVDEIKERGLDVIDNEVSLENTKLNLCSVGRFIPVKGYLRLMDVLYIIKNEGFINWHFYLLGEGGEKNKIEEKIKVLGLENNITLLGFQENPHKFVSKMDLFICSSYHEGYSTAVTEAIILGTPVLTTDCSGMAEILGNSNAGLIVENSDKGLEEGLKRILNEDNLIKKMKSEAIERSKFFSTEKTLKQFESLIDS